MQDLLKNIRFYILIGSFFLSAILYWIVFQTVSQEQLQIIRLNQIYGLISIGFLYLALLAGPLCYTFPQLPFKKRYLKARRAIGVSAFYFALLHALIGFYGQLGGLDGLGFLTTNYLFAISLSVAALFILSLL